MKYLWRRCFLGIIIILSISSFAIAEDSSKIILPADLEIIGEQAFHGTVSIEEVIVSEGTKEIHSKAFAESSLQIIELPESVSYIAEDAFANSQLRIIHADEDTYSFNWAAEHGYSTHGLPLNSVSVQDLYYYMGDLMDLEIITTGDNGEQYRRFSGGTDAYELIDEYVNRITSGAYNLKLVDSYYQSYGSSIFFSYALDYTGTGHVHGDKLKMSFVDGVYGDVTIYGSKERYSSTIKGYIYITDGLEYEDTGLRSGGNFEQITLPGASLYSDITITDDGKFVTSDNRFSVNIGTAMLYRDGVQYTLEADFARNQKKNREELRIFNFYRNESIFLTLPYNSVLTGDILNKRAIGVNLSGGYDEYQNDMEDFMNWTFSDKLLGVCHDGDYLMCYADDYNDFDDAVVRIMLWDYEKNVAVIYICATFDSAPYEYEVVAAVDLSVTAPNDAPAAIYNTTIGGELSISFTDKVDFPKYEVFEWEIVEGASLIQLSGEQYETCSIRALAEGTARVRVTYTYGVDGYHILTGNPITEIKTKAAEYDIIITP